MMVSKATHVAGGILTGVLLGMNPVLTIAGALIPDIDYPIPGLHRKLLHNVWTVAALWFLGGPAIAAGAASHLILDSLTKKGVKWLWPLPWPHIRGPIRTGSGTDYLIGAGMLATALLFKF